MKEDGDVIHFEKLNWQQIDELDREKTIFFLPISLLEEHGPHLPIGTDLLTSKNLAIEAIKILQNKRADVTGVLLPPVPLGTSGINSDFPGTITTPGKIIKEIIFSISSSLARHKFKYLIICSWHLDFAHLKGIFQGMHKAMSKYNMKIHEPTGPYFWSEKIHVWDEEMKKRGYKYDFEPEKEFHAGFRETSIMIYQHPELVDKIYTKLPTVYKNLQSTKECRGKTFKQMGIKDGYVGSPSNANEEYGKLHFQDLANLYADSAIALYENGKLLKMPKNLEAAMNMPFINLSFFWKIINKLKK